LSNKLYSIGLGGVVVVLCGIAYPEIRGYLIRMYHLPVILLLLCILLFSYSWVNNNISEWLSLTTFFMLGVSTACCEIKGINIAVGGRSYSKKIKGLQLYNMLKVGGIGLGFISGSLLASDRSFFIFSTTLTSLCTLLLIYLTFSVTIGEWSNTKKQQNINVGYSPWNSTKLISIILIILDVSFFTFWYIYLPSELIIKGFGGTDIAVFLALQSLAHILGQVLWRHIVVRIGSYLGFGISFILHLFVVVLLSVLAFDFTLGATLFIIMGLVNSGTFLSSSLLLYKQNKNNIGDNYLHLLASYFGKFIGAAI